VTTRKSDAEALGAHRYTRAGSIFCWQGEVWHDCDEFFLGEEVNLREELREVSTLRHGRRRKERRL
jgi:hypothetical protein